MESLLQKGFFFCRCGLESFGSSFLTRVFCGHFFPPSEFDVPLLEADALIVGSPYLYYGGSWTRHFLGYFLSKKLS
jgi:hypothetical protein